MPHAKPNTPASAPNLEAILLWCENNRPDLLTHLRPVVTGERDETQDAFLLLLTVGFAAGRVYQAEHPELDVHAYHR